MADDIQIQQTELQCVKRTFLTVTSNTTSLSPSSGPVASLVHGDDFDPVCVDVSEENFGSLLNDIDQLVDALPASLALPVTLVQEQGLEELHPQLWALQHRHRLLWKPGDSRAETCKFSFINKRQSCSSCKETFSRHLREGNSNRGITHDKLTPWVTPLRHQKLVYWEKALGLQLKYLVSSINIFLFLKYLLCRGSRCVRPCRMEADTTYLFVLSYQLYGNSDQKLQWMKQKQHLCAEYSRDKLTAGSTEII